ncbi:MAG TPA: PAS domain-containing protein [Terracidiphilus sp.]|nr:PAS domain-containing protein [Terracidiphilus sp.]
MDDVSRPVDGASPSVKAAWMIALISRVDIKTRLTLCFVLIIALMSVGTGILFWQSRVMRAQANRLKQMDEQFMEVQRVHALVLSFRDQSEQLVKARNLARLQQEAPVLRNQLNNSLRQTQAVFRGIEPNNTLDPTVLPTLETIQGLLPSQIDSLTTLASVADWDALSQRREQPVETLETLSAELVDTASRDLQGMRSESTRKLELAQNRAVLITAGASGLTIVVAALLGFVVTQSITRPLRSMVNGASALASGEFGHHLPVQGRDELAHLSQVFNQTAVKLQNLYENLRQSEQELRNVVNYLAEAQRLGHIGSWVFEPAGAFVYWSHELFCIYGLDPESGAPTLDEYLARVHPLDREFMASLIKRMIAEASGCDVTKRIVRPNGEVRHIRCVGAPVVEDGILKRIVGNAIDVTEHELLTQELRRREAYLAEAQRLSHTGSFGWNPHTGEIVWSDETYRIFEYDRAEKPTLDMLVRRLHPEDRAFFQQVIDRASQTAADFEHEYRLLLVDGRVKHVHAIARAIPDASGNREFIGAVTDITERKTAEEKILCNERELRTLIDIMPAYLETSLPDGTVDFLSQSWLDYSGQTREEVMGWGWAGTIHPDDVDRALANWQAGVASGETVEQELRCRRADGVYHWFLNRSLPLRDDEGKIVKWYGILFDVNALKETESALQMREHELLGIIETIPSMLWSTSPTGELTHISQRLLEYYGAPFEEVVNRWWERFLHPDDREETAKAVARAFGSGELYNVIHRLRRADGEYRWHHSMGEPLRDPHGEIIQWYGLATDIDERKRAEDHLRETRIKLAKASRLATVAELAASIAHELNQPLMSMLANAQAAKRWLNADPSNATEVNLSIGRIIRDARAADETMRHIRALFKQESFVKKDVKIPDLLNEVVRIVQEDPKKCVVPVECHFDESLPAIPVDQIQMQQVFINLIVNAIEALEEQQVAPLVELRAVTDSNGMLIQVIDNGTGVDDPDRIFDAFMTTKEKGMGIGLAVSRSTVEAHGGRLWVENNEAGGATFNVALPLSNASPTTAQIQEYA